MYNRNSKAPKTDPCGTPQIILKILDAKPFIDTNCLRSVEYDSNYLFVNHVFYNDTIYSTEYYDPQYQSLLKVNKNTTCKVKSSRAFIIALVRFTRTCEVE